jgi:hypothetical protein
MKKKTVKYLLMFIGLAIFLGPISCFIWTIRIEPTSFKNEIVTLSDKLTLLEGYNANLAEYQTGIDTGKVKTAEVLARYYSVETPEDFIMMATDMENELDISVSSLTFEDPAFVTDVKASEDMTDYTAAVNSRTLSAYALTSTIDAAMTYAELKKVLGYIGSQSDVTSLQTLDLSYDDLTGLILSTMTVSKYYVTGRDMEDHQPNVSYTDIGNDALIGG